ncbi:hypothetical protein [Halobacteriaceae bacterium SHR40]|uniref:hypothetical protein n=1 Tax=Halovenus amylolytica TaxID=2500550 RepID=UPI000FE4068B
MSEADLLFIECLAHLEVQGGVHLKNLTGERETRDHYLTEGHRWVVNRFDPDLDKLQDLELIQKPYIDGESRERIIRRRFWDLTSSGRDLVDIDFSGKNIGDPGEHVVHKLGHHLTRWWAKEQWGDNDFLEIESFPTIDGAELDFVVWNKGGFQMVGGEDIDKYVRHSFEIETGTADVSGIESDAQKLAYLRGDSWWVFPTRAVLVKALDELTLRGYTGLSRPIPETLAVRNHRDTYNTRLEGSEPEIEWLNHPPVQHVMTYKQLVDDLKQWRPELFYGASGDFHQGESR